MFEVKLCEKGDVFVFRDRILIWSPYGISVHAVESSKKQRGISLSIPRLELHIARRRLNDHWQDWEKQIAVAARAVEREGEGNCYYDAELR